MDVFFVVFTSCNKIRATCMKYDWIVVGGGPCGLTLATYLPGRVLLIEGRDQLGRCHAVHRDDTGRFGEHGPRYVNGCYVNLNTVLQTKESVDRGTLHTHYIHRRRREQNPEFFFTTLCGRGREYRSTSHETSYHVAVHRL